MRLPFAAALATVVAVLTLAAPAHAIEQPCPSGKVWDLNRGACVPKKKKIKKQSAEEQYYAALDHLDGRAKHPDPAKAVDLLGKACKRDLAVACTQLAFIHLRGRAGLTPSAASAIGFYEKSCRLGDTEGCIGAAEIYSAGSLGSIDHVKAVPLLEQGCTAGSGRACFKLAQKYSWALGVDYNDVKATELFTKAFGLLRTECDGGLGASCDLVGQMHQSGTGTTIDLAQALLDYDRGCKAGSGDACYNLGWVTDKGIGTTADHNAAYAIYENACRKYDQVDACFEAGALLALGTVYGDMSVLEPFATRACTLSQYRCDLIGYITGSGIGVALDLEASAKWYDLACDQGNGTACRVMGEKYRDGVGVSTSHKRATEYLEKACDLSESWGCGSAGKLFYSGDAASGLAADQARAFTLFDIGCLRDDHESCEWAAEMLGDGTDGTGVPDPQRAITYFETGCRLGRGQSCAFAGDYYRDGRATGTPDPYRAVEYYKEACWANQLPAAGACRIGAGMWHDGGEVTVDLLLAAQAMVAACRLEGGQDCITADGYLRDARAESWDKDALVDALYTTCLAEPPVEASCQAWSILQEGGAYAVPKNAKEAMARLDESCVRGTTHSCYLRGYAYENGLGPVANSETAIADYTRACEGGHHDGCVALGQLLGKAGKTKEALALYQQGCDDGFATACNVLGFAYYTAAGVRWDIAEATRLYEKGCELGDSLACSNTAEMWEYGIARDPDPAKAYELYSRACGMGFQGGCSRAARFVETGTGGATKDLAAAEAAYAAGCEVEVPEACQDLARLQKQQATASDSTIATNNQTAFDLAKEASASNPYYKWLLGTFWRDGVAKAPDATKAVELFAAACDGYDPLGCLDAGRLYVSGAEGLPANPKLGIEKYDLACAAKVSEACRLAKEARAGGGGSGKLPGITPKKGGCCQTGSGSGGGAALLIVIVGLVVGRRRSSKAGAVA